MSFDLTEGEKKWDAMMKMTETVKDVQPKITKTNSDFSPKNPFDWLSSVSFKTVLFSVVIASLAWLALKLWSGVLCSPSPSCTIIQSSVHSTKIPVISLFTDQNDERKTLFK